MRRSRVAIAAALPAVALGGYATFRLAASESSEPATVAAALARFRALPASARTLPSGLRGRAPRPGVYVYATRGFEVSHVLGTRRHPYPRLTTIALSVTPRGCLRTRWDVLERRRDETLTCARHLIEQREEHAFAGHDDRRTYRCTPSSAGGPARLVAGGTWRSRCAIRGTTIAERGIVVGRRTLALDGERIRTVLLRTTTRIGGETTGVVTTSIWILPRTRLIARRTIAETSSTDTLVGDVRYEERATLALTSARPRR